jgi:hypothetical protein
MDYLNSLIDLAQAALLGYLAWRSRQQSAVPDLKALVRDAIVARVSDGTLKAGRERLRARLAAKLAQRSTGE